MVLREAFRELSGKGFPEEKGEESPGPRGEAAGQNPISAP